MEISALYPLILFCILQNGIGDDICDKDEQALFVLGKLDDTKFVPCGL